MMAAALVVRLITIAAMYSGEYRERIEYFAFPSEVARVARSVATGDGFSSLFGHSGPTAWLAPV